MARPAVNNFVRLLKDLPELGLTRGQIGAVRCVWREPHSACEVEFSDCGKFTVRALLLEEAIHVVQVSLRASC
jgi:hypothetical protein